MSQITDEIVSELAIHISRSNRSNMYLDREGFDKLIEVLKLAIEQRDQAWVEDQGESKWSDLIERDNQALLQLAKNGDKD